MRRGPTAALMAAAWLASARTETLTAVPLRMSNVTVTGVLCRASRVLSSHAKPGNDVYMACSAALPQQAAHIVRFEPVADMAVVHHMLLYLCPSEPLV
jgi:hypothetical protein